MCTLSRWFTLPVGLQASRGSSNGSVLCLATAPDKGCVLLPTDIAHIITLTASIWFWRRQSSSMFVFATVSQCPLPVSDIRCAGPSRSPAQHAKNKLGTVRCVVRSYAVGTASGTCFSCGAPAGLFPAAHQLHHTLANQRILSEYLFACGRLVGQNML